jgi:hypothetical protein
LSFFPPVFTVFLSFYLVYTNNHSFHLFRKTSAAKNAEVAALETPPQLR